MIICFVIKTYDPSFLLGYPGRPVASVCGSLTENVSAFTNST